MFLDASVVVAILAREEGWETLCERVEASHGQLHHSPLVRFEATIALLRHVKATPAPGSKAGLFESAQKIFDDFVDALSSQEIDISPAIGRGALAAAQAYGKIVKHKAQLNFGDCFAYAAAKSLSVGLLYKGDDFALTDLA
jgi:ribonuclease VapC